MFYDIYRDVITANEAFSFFILAVAKGVHMSFDQTATDL